jgi:hypothetical protein
MCVCVVADDAGALYMSSTDSVGSFLSENTFSNNTAGRNGCCLLVSLPWFALKLMLKVACALRRRCYLLVFFKHYQLKPKR